MGERTREGARECEGGRKRCVVVGSNAKLEAEAESYCKNLDYILGTLGLTPIIGLIPSLFMGCAQYFAGPDC